MQEIASKNITFDIIFIDPPYHEDLYERTLMQLAAMNYVTANTMIIVEAPLELDFSQQGIVLDPKSKMKLHKFHQCWTIITSF